MIINMVELDWNYKSTATSVYLTTKIPTEQHGYYYY